MTGRRAVFDGGKSISLNPETNAGLGYATTTGSGPLFRTNERDKAPARRVRTAELLGDPAPGRDAIMRQMFPPATTGSSRKWTDAVTVRDAAGRICTESGPILLTRREYAQQYGTA